MLSAQWLTCRPDTLLTPPSSAALTYPYCISIQQTLPENPLYSGHSVRFWVGQSTTTNWQVLTEHSLGAWVMLRTSHAWSHLILIITIWGRDYYYTHLIDRETETSGGTLSKVWQTVSQDLDPHPDTTTPELNQKKVCFFKESWIYQGRLKKNFFPKKLWISHLWVPQN